MIDLLKAEVDRLEEMRKDAASLSGRPWPTVASPRA